MAERFNAAVLKTMQAMSSGTDEPSEVPFYEASGYQRPHSGTSSVSKSVSDAAFAHGRITDRPSRASLLESVYSI
jgi:hypothetical protein